MTVVPLSVLWCDKGNSKIRRVKTNQKALSAMLGAVQTSLSRLCPLAFLLTRAKCCLHMKRLRKGCWSCRGEKNSCWVLFWFLWASYGLSRDPLSKEDEKDLVGSSQHPGSTWCWESRTVLLGCVSARCWKVSGGRLMGETGYRLHRALHCMFIGAFIL